jgi:hypothetical protein
MLSDLWPRASKYDGLRNSAARIHLHVGSELDSYSSHHLDSDGQGKKQIEVVCWDVCGIVCRKLDGCVRETTYEHRWALSPISVISDIGLNLISELPITD